MEAFHGMLGHIMKDEEEEGLHSSIEATPKRFAQSK
jgi:hypothetical protein